MDTTPPSDGTADQNAQSVDGVPAEPPANETPGPAEQPGSTIEVAGGSNAVAGSNDAVAGSNDAVIAAVAALESVDERPLDEHPDAFGTVHRELQRALADIDDA